jgi:hypothetical protein
MCHQIVNSLIVSHVSLVGDGKPASAASTQNSLSYAGAASMIKQHNVPGVNAGSLKGQESSPSTGNHGNSGSSERTASSTNAHGNSAALGHPASPNPALGHSASPPHCGPTLGQYPLPHPQGHMFGHYPPLHPQVQGLGQYPAPPPQGPVYGHYPVTSVSHPTQYTGGMPFYPLYPAQWYPSVQPQIPVH